MQDLKISIVQSNLFWEQPKKNLQHFALKFATINQKPDLIVLPEMFNTGFTMNGAANAEPPDGLTFQWMKTQAKNHHCVITGSFLCNDSGHLFNRLVWMRPSGTFETYDKRHLFRFGNEHLHFTPGTNKLIVDLNGWHICPLICYDLRFPVWAKNTYSNHRFEYDLLLYVANWPEKRKQHWRALMPARAIENLAFVAGINRVGEDGHGNSHSGNSMIVSPKGEILCEIAENKETIETMILYKEELIQYRERFNVAQDWDTFEIK
ncbi:MAG: amidohydrolase [Bacteroidota bacterium]